MADSVSVVFRPMFFEDLAQSATLAQTTSPILNVGPSVAVTPFLSAASDAAAIAAGASVGSVYINTGAVPWQLKSVSGIDFGIGYGQTVNLANLTSILIATSTVTGAVVGDSIVVGTNPAFPSGTQLVMKVSAPNTISVEIWNMSGTTQTIPAFLAEGRVIQFP